MTGTSEAAPHVAGVAALWHHKLRKDGLRPNPTVLREMLYTNAEDRITPRSGYEEARRGVVRAPRCPIRFIATVTSAGWVGRPRSAGGTE